MSLAPALRAWLPLAAAISVLALVVEVATQQTLRAAGNDPQIGLAEGAAQQLAAGVPPRRVVNALPSVDVESGLGPWLAVYDAAYAPLASSARLDGAPPQLPDGVYASAAARQRAGDGCCGRPPGEANVTWQPAAGVRSAAVIVPLPGPPGGFVVAGRSLREVEVREASLVEIVALGWFAALVVSAIAAVAVGRRVRSKEGN